MMGRILSAALLLTLSFSVAAGLDLTEDAFDEVERSNSPRACYTLGLMYLQGEGVAQDKKQAMSWLKKSAEQGYYLALHRLGKIYLSGEVTKADPVLALEHISMSAGNGYSPSQYLLGTLYQNGERGIEKNRETALKWFKLAADQGYKKAEQALAKLSAEDVKGAYAGAQASFDKGFKFLKSKDYKPAAKWFSKAAKQGHADAQYNLGELYNKGRGIKRNKKAAKKWYKAAAAQGHVKAKYRSKGCTFC